MNLFYVKITAAERIIDEIEEKLCVSDPKEYAKRESWKRVDGEIDGRTEYEYQLVEIIVGVG